MRKISSSVKCSWSRAVSLRADSRSWPNGFSITSRVQPFAERRLPSSSTSVSIAAGGTAK